MSEYTVFHCGYLKGEQEMSDTPRTDALVYSSADLTQSTIVGLAQTLERENAAQLKELHRISEALGTNEGHSSVTHIEILKGEIATLRIALTEIECHHNETDDWREIARAALTRKENGK